MTIKTPHLIIKMEIIQKEIRKQCRAIAEGIDSRFKKIVESAICDNHRIIEYGDDWEIDWDDMWEQIIKNLKS